MPIRGRGRLYIAGMDSTPRPVEDTPDQDEQRQRRGERGQGLVEYAFILILIAIAALVALQVLGRTTGNLYSNISNGLGP
jgi:Flp pilus assembly pilin Flp